jgi:CheY-like chemotaxis protein
MPVPPGVAYSVLKMIEPVRNIATLRCHSGQAPGFQPDCQFNLYENCYRGAGSMFTRSPLIALVDDDRAVVQIVTAFLEAQEYRTVSCLQAAEAIALIESAHPDLVLLDIQMEQWDAGLKVLAALRQNASTCNVKVIVCSANLPLLRQQEQYIQSLGAEMLEKPYALDTLLAKVDAAFDRPPRLTPTV